ncbi:CDP-alcohol phosphatidyltransferase [Candidatus Termititenax persephonae]|uniref:CDP-alcohol phosphatidyltransferase n=1 Tax=Candidatus Termititenax persephonae TaxID=2218525 RepID=A0A388THH2_9BACT|nr:CDP-alcohol phosphatidyltransferase [Candidatus Termititenax persephonae]
MFRWHDRRGLKSYEKKFAWLVKLFAWLRFSPNILTSGAVFLAMLGGGFVLYDLRYAAVGSFLAAWFLTYFDGIYARQTATATDYGDFWNMLANLLCEIFLFVPLLLSRIFAVSYFLVVVLLLLLILRFLISLVLLAADNLKVKTPEVFFSRTELWLLF